MVAAMTQRAKRGTFRNLVMSAGLLGTVVISGSSAADAAPRTYPLAAIPVTLPDALRVTASASGGDVVVRDGFSDSQHINIASGVATAIANSGNQLTFTPAGPNFVAGLTTTQVLRRSVSTGVVETLNIGPPTWPWLSSSPLLADDAGRYVTFSASDGSRAATRAFVYDMNSAQLLPWSTDGLVTVDNQSAVVGIGAAGDYVMTADFFTAGAAPSQYVRWSLPSGANSIVVRPTQNNPFAGMWSVSPDLEWTLFPGSQADIVSGLDATTRWYRINNESGVIDAVPGSEAALASIQIVNGGRVILGIGPDETHLFTWDGGTTPLIPIDVAPDGTPADAPIDANLNQIGTNEDGTTITFATYASNLSAGGTLWERDFYQATLPSLVIPVATGKLAPYETRCVAAKGANAGDWVAVNVTPVDATTAGFGTLHSSDNSAGATANVNFTPGSTDPNIAITKLGADKKFCFTNSRHGTVNIILDQMAVSPAATFTEPTPEGATRLLNTRDT